MLTRLGLRLLNHCLCMCMHVIILTAPAADLLGCIHAVQYAPQRLQCENLEDGSRGQVHMQAAMIGATDLVLYPAVLHF
jgi:hypothetical protein